MPIVPGNEPRSPQSRGGGIGVGWILPLLILGPPIYRYVRGLVAGRITDQQLLIIVGGVAALAVLAVLVQRVNQMRNADAPRLPTSYSPPGATPSLSRSTGRKRDSTMPQPPRYEPMIPGKAVLAGLIAAGLTVGVGVLLLLG